MATAEDECTSTYNFGGYIASFCKLFDDIYHSIAAGSAARDAELGRLRRLINELKRDCSDQFCVTQDDVVGFLDAVITAVEVEEEVFMVVLSTTTQGRRKWQISGEDKLAINSYHEHAVFV